MRRGLVQSRERARELVEARGVLVRGGLATKSSRLVDDAEPIELLGPAPRYVSRGGIKLEHALDHFVIGAADKRCLDVGSSTGGFTDCLLQRGATSVVALDVGTGQLHWSLRNDPRVTVLERSDIRRAPGLGTFDLVVADVSFISLRTVLPALAAPAAGDLVVLVKPQFEVGRARVGKGGIVRDESAQREAVAGVADAARTLGLAVVGEVESPITGADGNREWFLHLRR